MPRRTPALVRFLGLSAATALAFVGLPASASHADVAEDCGVLLNQPVLFSDPATSLTAQVKITAVAAGSCLRTYELTYNNPDASLAPATHVFTERADRPRVRTSNIALDAVYAWSIDEAGQLETNTVTNGNYNGDNPMNCSADGIGCYITGANWSYVWTRDTAYAAALGLTSLDPLRMRNSLNFKISDRRTGWYDEVSDRQILQDTGTGGSYPVSTDRTSWAVGARAVSPWLPDSYREAFDSLTYEALRNTIEHDRKVAYNTERGLYTGETSFLDWRWQNYPSWIGYNMNKIAESMSLSTNVTHWTAINDVADLAEAAGDASAAAKYRGWADELAQTIDDSFWLEGRGEYSSLITGELDPAPTDRFDALATALVVLSGIAPADRAARAVANYPETPFGASTIWPNQNPAHYSEYGSYHNDSIWPFVVAFMHKAAVRVGNDTAAARQFDGLIRIPLIYGSNYENYNINNGGSTNTRLNSKRQTWSVAGVLGAFQEDIFGIRATAQGLTVDPFVTAQVRSKYFPDADEIRFENLAYKDSTVNVTVKLPAGGASSGAYEVTGLKLNNAAVDLDSVFTSAQLGSSSTIEATLGDAKPSVSAAAVKTIDGGEQQYGPNYTYNIAVDPDYVSGNVGLTFHQNWQDTSNMSMDVLRDGKVIAENIPADGNYIDTTAEPDRVSHCYSTRLRYNSSGNTSQPSAATCIWGPGHDRVQDISSADFDHHGGEKRESFGRPIIGGWGQDKADDATTPVLTVPRSGRYLAAYEYFLGSTPSVNDGLSAGIKMLDVIDVTGGGSDIVKSQIVVMASRGTWGDVNESTFVPVDLQEGHEYRFRLRNDRVAVNMGYFQANTLFNGLASEPFGYIDLIEFKLLGKEFIAPLTAGTVSVSGVAQVGAELTATPVDWPTDIELAYQWAADGDEIPGATGATFTPGVAQLGKTVTVEASAINIPVNKYGSQTAAASSDPTAPVAPAALVAGTVHVDGSPVVGQSLAAVTSGWQDGVALTYQWSADGADIAGATGDEYTVTADQLGKVVRVVVTGTGDARYGSQPPVSATSAPTTAVTSPAWTPGTVVVNGTAQTGQALSAVAADWPAHVALTYQWTADGADLSGATSQTLTLTPAHIGQVLRVKVTGVSSDPDFGTAPQTVTSAPTAAVAPLPLAAGSAELSGTFVVGETVTVAASGWQDGVTLSYQWTADGTAIAGANAATFPVTAAQIGKRLRAVVTGTGDARYGTQAPVAAQTAQSEPVAAKSWPPNEVTVDGLSKVGERLTAIGGSAPDGTGWAFQWLADNAPIAGATGYYLDLDATLIGKKISARITWTLGPDYGGATPSATSAQTAAVLPLDFIPGSVTISGPVTVGGTLTATPTGWQSDVAFGFQWFADGQPIAGATGSELVLTPAVQGKAITVAITGTPTGAQYGSQGAVTNPPTANGISGQTVSATWLPGTATITGTAKVREELTAHTSDWPAHVGPLSYQWLADGQPIPGQAATTISLTSDVIGKTIQVRISGVSALPAEHGAATVSVTSDPTVAVAALPIPEGTVTISGSAIAGEVLAAHAQGWPAGATLTYRWLNDVGEIAVGPDHLTLTPGLIGSAIRVAVTATIPDPDFGGASVTVTSEAVGLVAAKSLAAPVPQVIGEARVGRTLTAAPGAWAGKAELSYQWHANGVAIKGATSATLSVDSSLLGKRVTVRVTGVATDPLFARATAGATSAQTKPVARGVLPKVKAAVTGKLRVGKKVRAKVSIAASAKPVKVTYRWYAGKKTIKKATKAALKLKPSWVGKKIRVKVTVSKAGYASAKATSKAKKVKR
ncbi:hypothetical protein GCM10010401_12560 [Rarobacter faecitabidus]|uniref:Mannosylglycerate hydrolase MGH1-like glycoside hydrolase domain-containing protein n=1 Tax=Rarobacter faecitabidus TaxID=13243 RepID=A0A542Z8H7_RARFA|nr:hypothetical protein [Rarobacter faecitabidus]TQL56649.1 hypothetical protein FB461_2372 [Rarobacter faecitabidus]